MTHLDSVRDYGKVRDTLDAKLTDLRVRDCVQVDPTADVYRPGAIGEVCGVYPTTDLYGVKFSDNSYGIYSEDELIPC